ncbi:DNA cytosine methyltransferase [Candidatus Thiodiazotropha sp. LNASS1]|uniref:DNA cytosine methyltransferase n=1 Tax=Candidatus Thiodiazotropha sp. LNASS1 TaxID=3096260 RepID=UPI0034DE1D39
MQERFLNTGRPMILSLFSGCGGLDLGFETSGFHTGLAFDLRHAAVKSHNHNREHNPAHQIDITNLKLEDLDRLYEARFDPVGVVGGPPCQSFSRGNSNRKDDDPRTKLVRKFFNLALRIHRFRSGLDFIVMENVTEVAKAEEGRLLEREIHRLEQEGFDVFIENTNAVDFGVPQYRKRLILVAINSERSSRDWTGLQKLSLSKTVRDVIFGLEEPVHFSEFSKGHRSSTHLNHLCMTPKSKKFFDGSLKAVRSGGRSFKVLNWDKPSYTVSYGHREVHVHPGGHRRLSVYEAMLLQGFPHDFELLGTLSDQITQVSEAVPPPLAKAVANSIQKVMGYENFSSNASRAAA